MLSNDNNLCASLSDMNGLAGTVTQLLIRYDELVPIGAPKIIKKCINVD